MTWTNLTFGFGQVLTSTQQNQLQGNFAAIANGDSGAPAIQADALEQTDGSEAVTAATIRAGAVDQTAIGSSAVGQGELKTSTSAQSVAVAANSTGSLALTGGSYSMINSMSSTNGTASTSGVIFGNGDTAAGTLGFSNGSASSQTFYVDTRYFQASPPYDLGDGEIPYFLYLGVDSNGDIIQFSGACDPIWAYHGPTDIRAKYYRKGRGYRRDKAVVAEMLSGEIIPRETLLQRLRNDPMVEIEITQSIKNADMDVIPHPWARQPNPDLTYVLADPVADIGVDICNLVEMGESLNELLTNYIIVDNTPLTRSKPTALTCHSIRWRSAP